MKKRQRKKNAKKALAIMQAWFTIIQTQAIITQKRINSERKFGGVVPKNNNLSITLNHDEMEKVKTFEQLGLTNYTFDMTCPEAYKNVKMDLEEITE